MGETNNAAIKDKTTHSQRLRAAFTIARRIVSFEKGAGSSSKPARHSTTGTPRRSASAGAWAAGSD